MGAYKSKLLNVTLGGLLLVLGIGSVSASNLGGRTIGTPPNSGGYLGGSMPSFGGCNKDNTFCWSFEITPPAGGGGYYNPWHPRLEVYGEEARMIIEKGHILERRSDWDGRHYLVKTGWQSWFTYKNKTFDCAASYDGSEFYCTEWK